MEIRESIKQIFEQDEPELDDLDQGQDDTEDSTSYMPVKSFLYRVVDYTPFQMALKTSLESGFDVKELVKQFNEEHSEEIKDGDLPALSDGITPSELADAINETLTEAAFKGMFD